MRLPAEVAGVVTIELAEEGVFVIAQKYAPSSMAKLSVECCVFAASPFDIRSFLSYNIYRCEFKRPFAVEWPIKTPFIGEILIWEDGEVNSYSY